MEIHEKVSLARLNTFNIGGIARRLVELNEFSDLDRFAGLFKNNNFFCLGEGSNVLFPDHKFKKSVVTLGGDFADIEINKQTIKAGAGLFLPTIVHETTRRGLSGLEFAAGIPGSLGGAIMMNAGAWGANILNVITEITYLNENGKINKIDPRELDYGYRNSGLPDNILVLSASLKLEQSEKEKTTRAQLENLRMRRVSQPVEVPSAGSVFKNPPGKTAGSLIEKVGLKGAVSGGAMISKKHANFIINQGGARAADVLDLIGRVRRRLLKQFDIELELEICLPGDNSLNNGD